MLRNEKAMLESQYAHWRRLAAFYEEALREQQDLIENTEREKAALEREWQGLTPLEVIRMGS